MFKSRTKFLISISRVKRVFVVMFCVHTFRKFLASCDDFWISIDELVILAQLDVFDQIKIIRNRCPNEVADVTLHADLHDASIEWNSGTSGFWDLYVIFEWLICKPGAYLRKNKCVQKRNSTLWIFLFNISFDNTLRTVMVALTSRNDVSRLLRLYHIWITPIAWRWMLGRSFFGWDVTILNVTTILVARTGMARCLIPNEKMQNKIKLYKMKKIRLVNFYEHAAKP